MMTGVARATGIAQGRASSGDKPKNRKTEKREGAMPARFLLAGAIPAGGGGSTYMRPFQGTRRFSTQRMNRSNT